MQHRWLNSWAIISMNALELVELIREKPEAKKCTFILHKDMLRVETNR